MSNAPRDRVSLDWTYDLNCTDQNTLELGEVKCRVALEKEGAKLFYKYSKCLSKCRAIQAKGGLPLSPDVCRPGSNLDSSTAACYQKAFDTFDLKCPRICPDPPDCVAFPSCSDWRDRIAANALYFDRIPAPFPTEGASLIYCPASPSGAFVD